MTGAERVRRHRAGLSKSTSQENYMVEATQLKVPPPLPSTRQDLLARYKLKRRRSINDLVEEIVVKLWDLNEQFMKYVEPIYDSQAVEGSIEDNFTMAALLIRDVAKNDKHVEVAGQNLHTIKMAMKVVLRRFGISQPERFEQAELPFSPNLTPAAE